MPVILLDARPLLLQLHPLLLLQPFLARLPHLSKLGPGFRVGRLLHCFLLFFLLPLFLPLLSMCLLGRHPRQFPPAGLLNVLLLLLLFLLNLQALLGLRASPSAPALVFGPPVRKLLPLPLLLSQGERSSSALLLLCLWLPAAPPPSLVAKPGELLPLPLPLFELLRSLGQTLVEAVQLCQHIGIHAAQQASKEEARRGEARGLRPM
mmetsp:Transcript_167861/g.539162  ORF Transcript_167861/g.539162 Transcript_167861/m.539162 type:complete len:207 (+) Transcript_167861:1274-1894(+)